MRLKKQGIKMRSMTWQATSARPWYKDTYRDPLQSGSAGIVYPAPRRARRLCEVEQEESEAQRKKEEEEEAADLKAEAEAEVQRKQEDA